MNKDIAFSLVELMVVIAIVALLAAVAVPTYKDYRIRTRIFTALNAIDLIKNKQIESYNKYGAFGNAISLGLGSVTYYIVDNPTNYSPYIGGLFVNIACSNTAGEATIDFNSAAIGYTGTGTLTLTYLFRISSSGNVITQCVYRTDGSPPVTAALAEKYFPANCQTPLGNPTLVACPAVP